MDTQQINDALDRIFHEEDTRIVFWKDPEREFQNVLPFRRSRRLDNEGRVLLPVIRELARARAMPCPAGCRKTKIPSRDRPTENILWM